MADSSLVCYELYSPMIGYPDRTHGRGGAGVGYIAVHHMAGNLSVEQCGSVFQTREASAHYGIGSDGRIGQYVAEDDAAWALANKWANQHAISIELANDGGAESNWHVSDTAINRCIDLIVDIAQRRGWQNFVFTGNDDNGDLIAHRWYCATACPGDYLYSKFPYIAEQVNARIHGKPQPTPSGKITVDGIWGCGTTSALQKILGCSTVDGIISSQAYADEAAVPCHDGGAAWEYVEDANGSLTIVALQRMIGINDDGLFGSNSARALQNWLNNHCGVGLDVDGIAGVATCRALQNWINTKIN